MDVEETGSQSDRVSTARDGAMERGQGGDTQDQPETGVRGGCGGDGISIRQGEHVSVYSGKIHQVSKYTLGVGDTTSESNSPKFYRPQWQAMPNVKSVIRAPTDCGKP